MRYLVAPLLAVPVLVLAPAPAAHAVGTCQGQPATIESSTAGATIIGTEGPDVILATRQATINALGGDDLICVAGGLLDAGAGDDSVVVTTDGNGQEAHLGPGTNHYASPGATLDRVFSGTPSEPNLDVIDLGNNSDRLTVQLPPGSSVQAEGGSQLHGPAPAAQLVVQGPAGDTGAWGLRLPGSLTHDGASVGTFTNFASTFLDLARSASATVRGTPGDDWVYVAAGTVDIDLGAGRDQLGLGGSNGGDFVGLFGSPLRPLPIAGRIALGAQLDQLYLDAAGKVALDLRKGRLGKVKVGGVEDTQLRARRIEYTGTRRSESADAWGCRVTMRGGPGDDFLGRMTLEYAQDLDCTPQFRLYGQGGDDELKGGPGHDVLIGGAGRDRVNGHEGRDACSGEIKPNCET